MIFPLVFINIVSANEIRNEKTLETKAAKIFLYDYNKHGSEKFELVTDKIEKGVTVAIFGDDISKVDVYPLFHELRVPVTLTKEEDQQIKTNYVDLFDKEDLEKMASVEEPKSNHSIMLEPNIKNFTPLIILKPNNGKVFADFHEITVKDISKVNKGQLQKYIRDYIKEEKVLSIIEDYENAVSEKVSTMATSARFLASIRKTQTFHGDFYFAGYTRYWKEAGKHITDYLIYDNGDNEIGYDHLTVVAEAEIHSFPYLNPNGPPFVTEAYEGKLDNYYSTDILIDYAPDTSAKTLNNSGTYNFNVGFPWTVSFGYSWHGKSRTTMKGIGNKENQLYYNYFYNGGTYGLSTSKFTAEYSAMYKSRGTLLKLNYQNLFGINLSGSATGYDWYGKNWYVLSYDY
ncbi:hypothetical protein RZN25_16785 [Bacillaceae bacterium S4-13-56]